MTKKKNPPKGSVSKKQSKNSNNSENNSENHGIAKLTHAHFSGPLPPPAILQQYNEVVSGAAERILTMAEADAEHQRKMESSALGEAVKATKRGQCFGLAIGLAAFITVMFAVYHDCQTTAGIVGGTTVLGLVTVFVTGRIIDPQEKMIDAKKDND